MAVHSKELHPNIKVAGDGQVHEQVDKHPAYISPQGRPARSFLSTIYRVVVFMPEDPFKEFKHVMPIDEMLETTYSKANKRADSITDKHDKIREVKKQETKRIQVAYKYLMDYLLNIVKGVPDLARLPPFYFELAQILVDNDLLKQKLGRISGVIRVLEHLMRDHLRAISRLAKESDIREKRKQAFGRMKSVVDKLRGDLEFLMMARAKLRSLPVIDTDLPAVVIAGYPNVGKSSLVNNLCGSKIQVASYPFTTKEITIGLYNKGFDRIQFVDTPGILDRPMSERNLIERQAIAAIKHLANLITFLIDPTPNCGYPVDLQLELLRDVSSNFPTTDRVIILAKKDLIEQQELDEIITRLHDLGETDIVPYSAVSRENEEKLLAVVKEKVKPFLRRVK
nr:GTPase [Candidatus Sigynarchaeum springense]MDO8118688.1 GTPase [Candidatus Sigynarchaeota archaeon]